MKQISRPFWVFTITVLAFFHNTPYFGQLIISNESFTSVAQGQTPNGWLANTIGGYQFRCDSTNSSIGYSGASGGKNLMIRNSDNTGIYEITTSPINVNGLNNISIQWGSRVSVNFTSSGSQSPTLYYSTNGLNWNALEYLDNEPNSIWNLVNNGTAITLPPDADNAATLQFKWSIAIINSVNGTYRMDDITVSGLTPMMTPVVIKVDMSQEVVNPTGVHIQANFQGWNPSSTQMNFMGNNVYQYSGAFTIGDTLLYRFVNGSLNAQAENFQANCTQLYNNVNTRMHIVGNITDTVCFNSCSACLPPVITVFGCTDPLACNFNPTATSNDGTCLIAGQLCNDGSSVTTNDVVNNDCWCQGTITAGQCSELFISEYVEGLGNNKAIEIYNPTSNSVDLSNYGLARYSNGSDIAGDITYLTGATIGPNDVYVVALDKRDPLGTGLEAPIFPELEALADTFINPLSAGGTWPMYFSGNDAITLVKDNGLTQADLFGRIGEGPGFGGWNAYGTSIIGATLYISENHTLRRKNNITNGVFVNPPTFDVLIEYDSLPNNSFSGLGVHDCACNILPVPGCNSPNACNYNPLANQYDGSCFFPGNPCDDQNANTINDNYNANCSCQGLLYILGCTDLSACNFDSNANIDDGTCLYANSPCNDGDNNTMNDVVIDNCECNGILIIEGCTQNAACNYNSSANVNDGSCFYVNDPCNDGNSSTINDIVDVNCLCNGANYLPGCTDINACNYNPSATADNGTCLFTGTSCNDNNNNTINDVIDANCQCTGDLIIQGCTNTSACNYNPQANTDNGTCLIIGSPCNDNNAQTINDSIAIDCSCLGLWYIPGCSNALACNFNPSATVNDGSCISINDACDDLNASTINDIIDSSCICSGIIPPGCPLLEITANITQASCAGEQSATLQITVETPFSPYEILWSDGNTASSLDSLSTGWYYVSVTDSTNCTEVDSFYVQEADLAPIDIIVDTIIHNSCFGYAEGAISIHATGGTGLYYLTWNTEPIQTAITAVGLAAGTYTAHVEDTNGCSVEETITITAPNGQYPQITGVDSTANLSSTLYSVNFNSQYTYSWSALGGIITNTTDSTANVQWGTNTLGQITVTQSDSIGCSLTQTFAVQVGTELMEIKEFLAIYPNPVLDVLYLSNAYSGKHFSVYNSMGQLMVSDLQTTSIDVSQWCAGVYTLLIEDAGAILKVKFIKM